MCCCFVCFLTSIKELHFSLLGIPSKVCYFLAFVFFSLFLLLIESDPLIRSSPTGLNEGSNWASLAQALSQAQNLLHRPQQQQLTDAAGAAQVHDCLSRLHEAVILLQRENQQLQARVQQQQQQQMRLQAVHRLHPAPANKDGVSPASRAQSLSPFGTSSEVSASADGCNSSNSNAPLWRALSGSVLPCPEETPDEIRSAPNPSTPLLRGGDVSVEQFLST